MSTGRIDRRSLPAVLVLALAASVALEGMLVVLPHHHAGGHLPSPAACADPDRGAPVDAGLQRATSVAAKAPCLACAISSVVFASVGSAGLVVVTSPSRPLPVASLPFAAATRPWLPLLRGPPPTA